MKIAFDLRRINNPGIGRYMKCLTEAVVAQEPDHDYLLLLPPGDKHTIVARGDNVCRVFPDAPCYSLREQFDLPRLLSAHKVDVLHALHFNLPLRRVCPTVVTLHDVIYLACPADLPSPIGRLYYRGMMLAAVRLADRILTNSEFSRLDIIRRLRCDPGKIEAVHHGVDARFRPVVDRREIEDLRTRYGMTREVVLYTGIYKPRKNHAALCRAFRRFLENGGKADLVIAGPLGEGEQELRQLAHELGIADQLILTGFVSDHDLPALYSAARVYACPSLYEGFGFTVLEAMACGTPVVCSRKTSLPEVAGDAALYADPQSPEEFAGALQRAFFDDSLRAKLVQAGFANVERFSWSRAAARALEAYRSAAGNCAERAVYA
jgi:glycosyltransferase involved in cell wall biosynthesis